MAITDFDFWLDNNDLSNFNDVYSLYHSVSGIFSLFKRGSNRSFSSLFAMIIGSILILLNWLIKVNKEVNNTEIALFFGDSY